MVNSNVVDIGGKIGEGEKDKLLQVFQEKVKNEILTRMFYGDDMSKLGIQLDIYNLELQKTQPGVSEKILEILGAQIDDTMDLSPENIEKLSSLISAILLQSVLSGIGKKPLISRLEELGYHDIVLEYKKSLYFSYDFEKIIKVIIKLELDRISDIENFHFNEDGKKSILDFGDDEDSILSGIVNFFYEKFKTSPFNINNILHLGISGFNLASFEQAKQEVNKEKVITRI